MLYAVRLIKLPPNVKGYVHRDADDFNNIYINKDMSWEEQRKTEKHELEHIKREDFDNDLTIPEIENL